MEHFSEELKKIKVLLKEDIVGLRLYINNKYPHYPQREKAIVLANSIRSTISQFLGDLSPQHQQALLQQLIKNSLLPKEDGLFLIDVFETALSLEVEDDHFSDQLCIWVNGYISDPIELQALFEYKEKINEGLGKEEVKVVNEELKIEIPNQGIKILKPMIQRIIDKIKKIKTTYIPYINHFIDDLKANPKYLLIPLVIIILLGGLFFPMTVKTKESSVVFLELPIAYEYPTFPASFYYREIDQDRLKTYLNSRNSILEEEPYFSSIMDVAEEFQLNPLILFAIAGHEQGFVPKTHPRAKEIANNPYNVFYSWQHYNTDITDSSRIAARTVINLSKGRPVGKDPFKWINRRYAEDQSWYKGVRAIYNRLEKETEGSLP